jgi:hypothetical protein
MKLGDSSSQWACVIVKHCALPLLSTYNLKLRNGRTLKNTGCPNFRSELYLTWIRGFQTDNSIKYFEALRGAYLEGVPEKEKSSSVDPTRSSECHSAYITSPEMCTNNHQTLHHRNFCIANAQGPTARPWQVNLNCYILFLQRNTGKYQYKHS